MDSTDTEVRLAPDRGVAARWTLLGAGACLLALWVALDATANVLGWAFLALCLVVTSYPALQLVVPDRFVVRLHAAGVESRLPWQRARVDWSRVHVARVVTVAGEPVLELHVRDADDPGQAQPRATGVLLPLGTDLDALHGALERHLGVADTPSTTDPTGPTPRGA